MLEKNDYEMSHQEFYSKYMHKPNYPDYLKARTEGPKEVVKEVVKEVPVKKTFKRSVKSKKES